MKAQASPSAVRKARADSIKLVRPEPLGPQISVMAPRGNPPVRESASKFPVGTLAPLLGVRQVDGSGMREARSEAMWERNSLKSRAMGLLLIFAFSSPTSKVSLWRPPLSRPHSILAWFGGVRGISAHPAAVRLATLPESAT